MAFGVDLHDADRPGYLARCIIIEPDGRDRGCLELSVLGIDDDCGVAGARAVLKILAQSDLHGSGLRGEGRRDDLYGAAELVQIDIFLKTLAVARDGLESINAPGAGLALNKNAQRDREEPYIGSDIEHRRPGINEAAQKFDRLLVVGSKIERPALGR
ncbi:hypothetical protein GCM10007886_49150 [Methylobacterium gregans]|nr:hypothetical protein GCM10007886_49150 [Methylobacterium gregans]